MAKVVVMTKNKCLFHLLLAGCHFSEGLRTKLGFANGSKHVSIIKRFIK